MKAMHKVIASKTGGGVFSGTLVAIYRLRRNTEGRLIVKMVRTGRRKMEKEEFVDWVMIVSMLLVTGYLLYMTIA
jgi:hypothetical protein